MKLLILLGIVGWSLSAPTGAAYAADSSFLSSLKGMLYNVAQRSDLSAGASYVMNDAPSNSAVPLPPNQNEWAGEVGYTVQLNPKLLAFSTLELGIDNRILRTKFGVTRALWSGGKP